ncbi:MAG: hypothetical protein BWY75_03208 [bacterium ADurb.Bin425]|nr:MAG: hypothetical protein BWY75_03208 [bacterium ADurb.Bin425]
MRKGRANFNCHLVIDFSITISHFQMKVAIAVRKNNFHLARQGHTDQVLPFFQNAFFKVVFINDVFHHIDDTGGGVDEGAVKIKYG